MKKYAIPLMAIVVIGILLAGCTRPAGTGPVTTAAPEPSPTEAETAATVTVPQPVVTIIHYISQTKLMKDPDLLFALQIPVEWNVSTYRLIRTDSPDYRTDLAAGTVFSIYSYYFSRDQDKAYREQFRQWYPAPNETTVTINDITFDRFESTSEGKTRVAYVAHKSSANERGYVSVLVFTAHDSNRFEKEDFERIVSSFRYFGGRSAGTEPGEDIPLYDLSGNALSRDGGGSLTGENEGSTADGWDSAGSGGDSSGGSSSGGGCGCG
ncbi:MAG: hypothetical protein EHM53_05040 [Methanoregulaceae archaeon]|nr:MAG: hypothetical protein EHM53_05040 [Methanoregulaceae archaeon]